MGLFDRLFGKQKELEVVEPAKETAFVKEELEWEELPGYLPADSEEYNEVALIATAIAAGDYPESTFKVKSILKRNPEAHVVSLIATSIAAGNNPESQFQIKTIKKKVQ